MDLNLPCILAVGEATPGVLGPVQTPEDKRDMNMQDRFQQRFMEIIKAQKVFSCEEYL